MNRKLPVLAAILIIVVWLLVRIFKLGMVVLGGWLVYTGFLDIQLDAFSGWTIARFIGGAFLLYVGFAFKFRFFINFK